MAPTKNATNGPKNYTVINNQTHAMTPIQRIENNYKANQKHSLNKQALTVKQ